MKKKIQISFWVFIALTVLLVIFSVQNSDGILVKILFWDIYVSLAILLIGTFLTGLITGALYAYRKLLSDNHKIEKELEDITEIDSEYIDVKKDI